MECLSINGIRFDQKSHDSIEAIRNIQELSNILPIVASGGVILHIFTGNGALISTYNVANTDWVLFAQSMKQIPSIKRQRIETIAASQYLRASDINDPKQKQFWRAVYDGCSVH